MQRIFLFRKTKRMDPYMEDANLAIDFRDVKTLSRCISERGSLLPRRLTGLTAYNQRKVSKAIKRSQNLGLIPFSAVP
jgi:small subunit ribosomal protein S18